MPPHRRWFLHDQSTLWGWSILVGFLQPHDFLPCATEHEQSRESVTYTFNLSYSATYLMVISGPGLMLLWDNKVDPKQADVIDFITYPGAGNRLSQTQIRELRGNRRSREVIAFYDQKTHYKVTPTAEQKAGYFRSIHYREATVKSAHELKVESDRALERYNNAVWLKVGREYQ
ncbi:MAG: hypothetical protein ACREDR_05785, partial [Blastocatellia bacterium]